MDADRVAASLHLYALDDGIEPIIIRRLERGVSFGRYFEGGNLAGELWGLSAVSTVDHGKAPFAENP